jgi:molybdenum cofactor cytidylyltransferase
MVSAIVLAAGKSEPTEKPKLFLPLGGKTVLQWVLESVLATAVSEVICVVRDLLPVRAHISLVDERLSWLVNDQADMRRSSSVIAGLWAVDRRSDGALFVAGDQTMLDRALIDALIERFEKGAAPIVAPHFRGAIRNPAIFRRELFHELLKLKGDHDGRAVIKKYRARLERLPWSEKATSINIANQKDHARIKALA